MVRKKRTGQKLAKKECEVCGCNKKAALHLHHIIPRCDARSSNNLNNLACLCSNCHNLVHSGQIIIIGVYSTTAGSGRKLMYFFQGEQPPLEEQYWKIHPSDNPLVIQSSHTKQIK